MKELTIFYIDDDHDDLDYFTTVVKTLGKQLKVITHDKAEKLFHALENPPPAPHLLFLDLNMPGLNGFDILQELKNSSKHADLPVIIFSTSTDEDVIERTRTLGASYYLPKSNNHRSLTHSIQHILNIDWEKFTPNRENFFHRIN